MKSLYAYFKQRFPIIPLFLFALLTIAGISEKIQVDASFTKIILLSLVYISFLLHLRVLDEFKDYDFDKKYHPERPVQSGKISLEQIKLLGIGNFILMLIVSVTTSSGFVVLPFFLVLFYSFLMFKEFFIHKFYEKTPTFYLISHQIVFLPLYFYFFSSLQDSFWKIDNLSQLALFTYAFIPVVLIEIGRKMTHRFDKYGRKTKDSYAFVWGEKKAIKVFASLIILTGLLSFGINDFSFILSLFILNSGLILLGGSFWFSKLILKFNMILTIAFALGLPALLLI